MEEGSADIRTSVLEVRGMWLYLVHPLQKVACPCDSDGHMGTKGHCQQTWHLGVWHW